MKQVGSLLLPGITVAGSGWRIRKLRTYAHQAKIGDFVVCAASRVGMVSRALVMAALGLGVGGCGDLGDAISGDLFGRDCHPDPKTVAALRQEPVLIQAPPGATLAAATDTVSCGWESSEPPILGMLDREITGAGSADEVSRFYADLARSSGWQAYGQGSHVYDASKPDGTDCTWLLQVLETAGGSYHVRITYTPRDLRPTCL